MVPERHFAASTSESLRAFSMPEISPAITSSMLNEGAEAKIWTRSVLAAARFIRELLAPYIGGPGGRETHPFCRKSPTYNHEGIAETLSSAPSIGSRRRAQRDRLSCAVRGAHFRADRGARGLR